MSQALEKFSVGPYRVTLDYDQDAGNPLEECDGIGTIRSFNSRHHGFMDPYEAVELMKSDPDIVPLAYYEHGNCMWMGSEGPHPAGVEFQWDGRQFAGIWIPDDCVRESYQGQDGLTRAQWMVKQAEAACETYTAWCTGAIYDYPIKDEDGGMVGSCSGIYDFDECKEEAKSEAESLLEERHTEAKKIDDMLHL